MSLHIEHDCSIFPAYPIRPAPGLVEGLIDALAESERPLIVSCGGIMRSDAEEQALQVAERLNVPVCTAMADDRRLSIGVIRDNGFHPHANRSMEESDFVLFVGSRMRSVAATGWTFPKITLSKCVARTASTPR